MLLLGLILTAKVTALVAAKLAMLAKTGLLFATTGGSSSTPIIVIVLIALLGSGGLGYWLDRRGNQASRLAQDAVSATDVFQRSLAEERTRRDELQEELEATKAKLATATTDVEKLERRVADLEGQLAHAEETISRMTS